jgi:hypothetical protein
MDKLNKKSKKLNKIKQNKLKKLENLMKILKSKNKTLFNKSIKTPEKLFKMNKIISKKKFCNYKKSTKM